MPVVATTGGLPTRLGKYEIMMPLAAGGMARIYIGRTTGIGSFERHVVLKLITPERANDHTAVQMFLDEARLAASLNHQNVGQVFEVGEDGGIHYLAMEYVHGQDLRALLAKAGSQGTRVPLELALTVVAGAAAGLNHAHERRGADGVPLGIVHRDVSPSNIMIGYDGSVKLLDFGIAKATARSVETQSGIIKGKFAYMAPEQCRGRDVDRRSDVFSLGIILYEISTQHRCFRADSDFDTMHRIVTGDVVRPTRLVQGYPQALEAIVMKALAVDPNQRYQSAGLLLEAIESFAVSARMSLSTMSLGRFMRDMFGDQQEPWLTQSGRMGTAPIQPRESTISNTNGGAQALTAAARPTPQPMLAQPAPAPAARDANAEPDAPDAPDENDAPDAPDAPDANDANDANDEPDENDEAAWRPPAPASVAHAPVRDPSRTSSSSLPSVQLPASTRTSSPSLPTVTPTPRGPQSSSQLVPVTQFSANPGSGSSPSHPSHPAHPAHRPSQPMMTRPGYASGASAAQTIGGQHISEPSYPRYQAPDDESLQLTPNRRPLFIGLGLAAAGLVVLLVVTLGGGDDDNDKAPTEVMMVKDEPEVAPDKSTEAAKPVDENTVDEKSVDDTKVVDDKATAPDAKKLAIDPPTEKVAPQDATSDPDTKNTANVALTEPVSIALDITSDPPGADVLLAGKVIGMTPLKTKVPKGTTLATIVVHKAHYEDASKDIDLGADFTNRFVLKKIEDPIAKKTVQPKVTTPKKEPVKTVEKKVTTVEKKTTAPVEKKPACQPPGQVDPFDSRPPCK